MAEVEIKKNTNNKTVNFYHLEGKEKNVKKVNDKFKDTFLHFKNHNTRDIETEDIDGNEYYIHSIKREYYGNGDENHFLWLISLSRLDPTSPIEIGDLNKDIEKRNKELPITDKQGRVINTQFLYNCNTHVCAFTRTNGGTTKRLFERFLRQFCDVRGITLAIIPEKDEITKLDKMTEIFSMSYSIAKVSNFSNIKDPSRSELKDIDYAASDVDAIEMTMMLKTKGSSKIKNIRDKIKFLFSNSENLGIKKLQFQGKDDDGIYEPVDLLKHKLVYKGVVEYDNFITEKNMFNFLVVAYVRNEDFLYKYFCIS